LELSRVSGDPTAVDVQVTHHFRAHFDSAVMCGGFNKTTPAALESSCSPKIVEVAHSSPDESFPIHSILEQESISKSASLSSQPPSQSSREDKVDGKSLGIRRDDTQESSFVYDLEELALRDADSDEILEAEGSGPAGSGRVLQHDDPRSLWEIDPSAVHIGHRVAVGGFAEVFLGKFQGTLVAVKLLLNVDESAKDRFLKEVSLMASLRHPNLLLFMGYVTHPRLAIVTEYMHRGSLYKVLRKGGDVPLAPRLQKIVALSVAKGMGHLHSRKPPLLHMDLKSPNILVDERWRVKIADFGLSRVRQTTFISGAGTGTPEWMAPEVLRSEHYDEKADVYSYGVCVWECLTGQPPWHDLHPMQVVGAVGFQGNSLPLPTEGDPVLIDLCRRCMQVDPSARPSFPEIIEELEKEFVPLHYQSMTSTLSESDVMLHNGGFGTRGMAESLDSGLSGAVAIEPGQLGEAKGSQGTISKDSKVKVIDQDQDQSRPSMTLLSPFAGLAPFSDDEENGEERNADDLCTKEGTKDTENCRSGVETNSQRLNVSGDGDGRMSKVSESVGSVRSTLDVDLTVTQAKSPNKRLEAALQSAHL
jgi:serine/threonine protein kinase